jgi:hypothetical protein
MQNKMKNTQYTQDACNSIKTTIETSSFERLGWIIEKFKDFKKECYTNEQSSIIDDILCACRNQYKILTLEQEDLKKECELNSFENQSNEQ